MNGKPSTELGELKLRDGQNIVIGFGDEKAAAPGGIEG